MRVIAERADAMAEPVAAMEALAQEQQQQLQAAKQRATELLASLTVPDAVSTMEACKALDTASLRQYWPFFEAKREREALQAVTERLQMRVISERVDAAAAAAKRANQ